MHIRIYVYVSTIVFFFLITITIPIPHYNSSLQYTMHLDCIIYYTWDREECYLNIIYINNNARPFLILVKCSQSDPQIAYKNNVIFDSDRLTTFDTFVWLEANYTRRTSKKFKIQCTIDTALKY